MTTYRYQQSDLNKLAVDRAHPFQKEVLEYMLSKGWEVQTCKSQTLGGHIEVTVVTISHPDAGFGMIAPNGLFQRPSVGKNKVEWLWSKMKDLAEATIPAPHVLTARKAVALAA